MKEMPEHLSNRDNLEFNEAFVIAYDLLENSLDNIFITGKAGTGKSTLLRFFRENTVKNIVVLAPTGVSAVNIKGQTIHSFFRFKPDITPDTVHHIKVPKAKRDIFAKLTTIVIDEISMVRADLLDCINVFLKLYGPSRGQAFGGVQMVFFGDLFQLPPVVMRQERSLFQDYYSTPYFFSAKYYNELNLECIELQKIYRQKEEDFIKLLNNIRNNTIDQLHLKELNRRCDESFVPQNHEFYIYLTTTNQMADTINYDRLKTLPAQSMSYEGEIEGRFGERNLPTHLNLELKVDSQIMLLNNDPMGRWINGTIGRVLNTHGNEDGKYSISVELSNGRVISVEEYTWEMYQFYLNEDTGRIESELVGSFKQFPLRLAWAVTIHKSQGKSFSKVVVDFGNGTFAHGQAYVALSRCESMDGLVLKRPVLKRHIILDQCVVKYMEDNQKSFSKYKNILNKGNA